LTQIAGRKKITAKPIDTRFSKFNAQRVFFGEYLLEKEVVLCQLASPRHLPKYLNRNKKFK